MAEIINKLNIQQTQQFFERSLRIGNITSLIECMARLFTTAAHCKKHWCGDKQQNCKMLQALFETFLVSLIIEADINREWLTRRTRI